MPVAYTIEKAPNGKNYARSVSTGAVTLEEAKQTVVDLSEGGKYFGLPLLAIIEEGSSFSTEAREAFTQIGTDISAVAIVVPSVALRVTLNFVVKASSLRTGKTGNTRFFTNLGEAKSWLESQMA